jgi:hypothetical protein
VLSRELQSCLASREGSKSSLGTETSVVVVLGRTITAGRTIDAQVVHADVSVAAAAGGGDGSRVAKVLVDADKVRGHAAGSNILNHNVTRAVRLVVGAVTAAAVEFARVGDSVVADCDATTAIVLDDLVVGASGTATLNKNLARSKSRNSVYSC